MLKPNLRALPAMMAGVKKALSRKISTVVSVTDVGSPPIMPANATAPFSSAMTNSSAFKSIV